MLFYANKSDLPGALKTDAICNKMKLNTLNDRPWHIFESCAISGQGIGNGLDWLIKLFEGKIQS